MKNAYLLKKNLINLSSDHQYYINYYYVLQKFMSFSLKIRLKVRVRHKINSPKYTHPPTEHYN